MANWRFAGILLLASGSLLSQAQRRELLVGAAKVDITPESPLAMSGYPDPETRISEGIHDRLYARAIAFKNGGKRLVLVSCDLSGFQYTPAYFFQKEIFAKFDLKPDELFLCGTHTHSGPMLFLSKTYPHPNTSTYTEGLRAKLLDAVGRALNAAAPAWIAAGVGQSPIAVNRRVRLPDGQTSPSGGRVTMGRNPDGPVDREVQVLKIARRDGVPIASIFDYACHSRSLRAANKLISGDIFGIAEQFVERTLGHDLVAPAFAGASGDIDPWYVVPGFQENDGKIPETVLMGTSLGEEVVRVFRNATELAGDDAIRTMSERLAVPGKTADAAKHLQITVAAVGDVAFVGLDCEALVEIGKAIKAGSPFPYTLILTNCNGGSGYLPPAHLYAEKGYEVDLSGFGPDAAGMAVKRVLEMLSSLRR